MAAEEEPGVQASPRESMKIDYQVWVEFPHGQLTLYRDGLIYSVAQIWAGTWNKSTPADMPGALRFFAVRATSTTTYEEI